MTREEVRSLIEREIAGDLPRTNLHGCDLRRCLVPPELHEYSDAGPGGAEPYPVVRLWLVLEEMPGDRSGYKIVFSSEKGVGSPGTELEFAL